MCCCRAGPFAKALNYDALPSAQPLLGSANPDFGVPVYSKAAAVMAMLTMYSATARQGDMHQAALAAGPVATLVATDPPGELQVGSRAGSGQHTAMQAWWQAGSPPWLCN